jgi:4-hydroxy-tetrahydrodipicolinate reductase
VIAIAVHGAAGRMGRNVIDVVSQDPEAQLVAAIEHAGHAALGKDAGLLAGSSQSLGIEVSADLARGLERAQVVIDFSIPDGAAALFEQCARARVPVVTGTTGLPKEAKQALERLASVVPVVSAPNFSVGVNLMLWLVEQAVKLAGSEFDIEIVEMHHKRKVDAPSGTALRIAEVAARARGVDLADVVSHGRSGQVGARPRGEIGLHALRGGDVVGDHTLVLAGPGEQIELSHRAHSREIFARGAVRAAHFVVGRTPGLYGMADVLGTK